MIEEKKYDKKFYNSQTDGSFNSAQVIIPIINELIHPASVLDVGCGVGTWLKVWHQEFSITDYTGVDGAYVKEEQLKIASHHFIAKDLKLSFDLGRTFDLVMCLEVGEHLPHETAPVLVDNLVRHGGIIVFSSANLHQRGTYHINEQPPEYWAKLFIDRGYKPVDIIRDRVWTDDRIEWWYRQNIIMYVKSDIIGRFSALANAAANTNADSLFRIHPLLWKYRNEEVEERSHWLSFFRWKLSSISKKIFSGSK